MSYQRVSGFPEKGADLWRGPVTFGKLRRTSGKSGKFPENLWIALKIHSSEEENPSEKIHPK